MPTSRYVAGLTSLKPTRPLIRLIALLVLTCLGAPTVNAATVRVSAAANSSAAADVDPSLAAELQAILDEYTVNKPVPGVSAAVILSDGSRWASGGGQADRNSSQALMGGDTRSVIGSITKTFVAALILQLVEEGRLSLKSRLSRWFPEYPFASSIRIRNLLRHTSGLADYFTHPDYARLVYRRPDHHWTPDEILGLVRSDLLFPPGHGWSYSNTNYLFLGLIAEQVTGDDLATELKTRFFEPYGLANTYFQADEPSPAGTAQGYLLKKSGFVGFSDGSQYRPNTSAATVAWAAGAIVSSASEVATWTRALYSGSVVSRRSLTKVTRFNASQYGFATMLFDAGGNIAWGHTGSLRGYDAMTWHVPASGITVSALINRGRINPVPIVRRLTEAIYAWNAAHLKAA